MIRRHPHVFGSPAERAAGAAPGFWERIKADERAEKISARTRVPSPLVGEGQGGGDARTSAVGLTPTPNPSPQGGGEPSSVLDGVPAALPALTRAVKLQNKAVARAQEEGAAALGPLGAEGQADEARRRVAGKTDEELAESYEIAVEARARAEKSGNEKEVGYWELLVQAAVREAVNRPAFGEVGDDESIGRREKKQSRQEAQAAEAGARRGARLERVVAAGTRRRRPVAGKNRASPGRFSWDYAAA